ncbi:hypothetical protein ACFYPZ_39415 [Streptomyces sp. NPDC005506]|uniref:hypothetical protein n=1 Tax=Streptomyces sp. NPDC005506 TaxID=3364718 RepID=UPI00367D3170
MCLVQASLLLGPSELFVVVSALLADDCVKGCGLRGELGLRPGESDGQVLDVGGLAEKGVDPGGGRYGVGEWKCGGDVACDGEGVVSGDGSGIVVGLGRREFFPGSGEVERTE